MLPVNFDDGSSDDHNNSASDVDRVNTFQLIMSWVHAKVLSVNKWIHPRLPIRPIDVTSYKFLQCHLTVDTVNIRQGHSLWAALVHAQAPAGSICLDMVPKRWLPCSSCR